MEEFKHFGEQKTPEKLQKQFRKVNAERNKIAFYDV